MEGSYNSRCPAVKRLLKEAQELHEATEEYFAHPVEDNLFEWHFTVRGPPDTEFEGGVYHGRIIMPADYPMKPPNIIFFTPNGRFEINKKICLSISGHHPETWQPSWSIRTALLAIIGFMPTPANGTIGSLDYTPEERAYLSKKSVDYNCCKCGRVGDLLKERTGDNKELQEEAKQVSSLMTVTGKFEKENSAKRTKEESEGDSAGNSNKETESSEERKETEPLSDQPLERTTSHFTSSSDSSETTSDASTPSRSSSDDISATTANIHPSNQGLRTVDESYRSSVNPPTSSLSLMANNIILSAAVVLLVALVLRRLFLLESEPSDEMDEILV